VNNAYTIDGRRPERFAEPGACVDAIIRATASDAEALSRLDLARPTTLKDRLYRALVLHALHTVESEQRP